MNIPIRARPRNNIISGTKVAGAKKNFECLGRKIEKEYRKRIYYKDIL